MPFFILFIFCLPIINTPPIINADDLPPPRGYYINCGSSREETIGGVTWSPDQSFISSGNSVVLDNPDIMPLLSTVRYFPDESAKKYCYMVPVAKGARYLIRSTYYYGGFDGGKIPPVFDQIVDGTRWSTVDTTQNYANGLTSYYEIIVETQGKTLSFCLARKKDTTSNPFINALEFVNLENSMYNTTDFSKYALVTIARHRFGYVGPVMSYPDDPFNRNWEPFTDSNPVVLCNSTIVSTEFWNLPPEKALQTALTTSKGKQLLVSWPNLMLPAASYYIALYFQDNRVLSPYSWRVFDVSVNGMNFYKGLNVTSDGVMVYAMQWPLSGKTDIMLTPQEDSPVGPLINAGEVFQIVPFGKRTITRDIIVMEDLVSSLANLPPDWRGDPCLPSKYSWTGVTCELGETNRVVGLNLTNLGLTGTLPDSIAKLTALQNLWLSGNKLSGQILEMGSLKNLVSLRLDDNQFSGSIPSSLGELQSLKELFLQNNQLTGSVPSSLTQSKGKDIRIDGNKLS